MYAIVEIAGQQFKVTRGTKVYVNRLEANEGSKVEFDKVLLIDNDGKIVLGSPTVDGARVAAQVLSHLKGDKVIVFKKKRRKGYQKLNGHRQMFSQILVQDILGKGEKLKAEDSKPLPKKKEVAETAVKVKKSKVAEDTAELMAEAKAPAKKTTKKKAV